MAMDGDDIIDLKTKENLGNLGNLKKIYTDTINDELIYYKNTTPVTSYDLLNTSAATPVTIPGTVPNYSYNPNGICGSTATAMMLRYLDIYFPSDYVPASLETSDGIALINYLVPYLHDPGSYLGELWGGIIDYLRSQNINDYVVWDVAVMGLIINVVSNSHPYVLGLHQHPKYSEHWVTGYGYYNATTGYAIVNDGWGSTYVFIDLSYADYMVWLE